MLLVACCLGSLVEGVIRAMHQGVLAEHCCDLGVIEVQIEWSGKGKKCVIDVW